MGRIELRQQSGDGEKIGIDLRVADTYRVKASHSSRDDWAYCLLCESDPWSWDGDNPGGLSRGLDHSGVI